MGRSFKNLFLLGFLFVSTKVLAAAPKSFEEHLLEGDRHFKLFEDQKALAHYQVAHELRPDDFEAHVKLLRTNNSIGQSLRDNGGSSDLVRAYFKKNVRIAEELYKKHPERVESPFSLAIAYGNLALYSSPREKVEFSQHIEENLKKSIAIDPNFPYSYLGLGIFYREVSRITFLERFFANLLFGEIPSATLEDAEKNFKMALQRDPTFIFTHYHYALCLEYADRNDEAIKEYQKVINLPRTESQDLRFKQLSQEAIKRLKPPSSTGVAIRFENAEENR
jgi:tetratricopeptide (TPR) repeat protein